MSNILGTDLFQSYCTKRVGRQDKSASGTEIAVENFERREKQLRKRIETVRQKERKKMYRAL